MTLFSVPELEPEEADKEFLCRQSDSVSLESQEQHKEFEPLFSVKTNLLYWATVMPDFHSYTFVPNLELEWFFCDSWSLSAIGNFAKWPCRDDEFFGISTWSAEPRWWPSKKGTFRWFYLGAYFQGGSFDVQNERVTFDGNTGRLFSAGISAGVAIPITKNIGFEIGLRAGYRYSLVKEYVIEEPHYYFENKIKDNFWGITGIKASFYFRFGSKGGKDE